MIKQQQRKPRRSERDKIATDVKTLTRLLLWEASNGKIALPKGLEDYQPPLIAFSERLAAVKMVSGMMLADLKVDPEDDVSGFDLLRGGYGHKRDGGEGGNGSVSSSRGSDEPAEESAADSAAAAPDTIE